MESKLINVKAAARMLNRHPSTVSNMMKKGELPHVTLHGRRYIDQAVIERLLAQADPTRQNDSEPTSAVDGRPAASPTVVPVPAPITPEPKRGIFSRITGA
jgi:hypothetical protein